MRPDITKAQIIASVSAGVPVLMNLLVAFGVFVPSSAEQHALTEATQWATGFAVLLVVGDAHLRASRNKATATNAHGGRINSAVAAINDARRAIEHVAENPPAGVSAPSAEPGRGAFARTTGEGVHLGDLRDDDDGAGDADVLPSFAAADAERVPADEGDIGPEVTP